jgi:hypothetical protein
MTAGRPALVLIFLLVVVLATLAGRTAVTVVTTGTALAAGVACLVQAARRPARCRPVWTCVGTGMLLCAAGHATATGGLPGPAWFGLVGVVGAGLPAIAARHRSGPAPVRALLGTLLIVVALLTLGWTHVMIPAVAAGLPIAYPVADVVLATVALAARVPPLVSAGLLTLAVANSGALRLVAAGAGEWTTVTTAVAFGGPALVLLAVLDARAGTTAGERPRIGGDPGAGLDPAAVAGRRFVPG